MADPTGRNHVRHLLYLSCTDDEISLWIQQLAVFLNEMMLDLTEVHELLSLYPCHTRPVLVTFFQSCWHWMKRKDWVSLYLEQFSDGHDPHIHRLVYDHLDVLHNHPAGNYMVQWLIQDPRYRGRYIRGYHGQVRMLCRQKYSSIVVETCMKLECAHPSSAFQQWMDEFIVAIPDIIHHMYGNYVVQTTFHQALTEPIRSRIIAMIESTFDTLRFDVYQKWKQWIQEWTTSTTSIKESPRPLDGPADDLGSMEDNLFDPIVNIEQLLQSIESCQTIESC